MTHADKARKVSADGRSAGRTKRWAMRVALAFLAPLLFLVLLELSLRLVGYGHTPRFFIPGPQAQTLVSNPAFAARFFGSQSSRAPMPIVFTPARQPDTYRIFVFGSSAALGDPDCSVSFARILECMLAQCFPDVRFEVINTAMTAINSHVVRVIAAESARYKPDLYVVYTGNNEVIGPYGLSSGLAGIEPALPMIRAVTWLRGTRTGQGVNALVGWWRRQGETRPPRWRGMEAFLGSRAPLGDPRLERVYDQFAANLGDIADTGRRAGADVMLCTLVTNLKDCPPFRSEHRDGLSADALSQWTAAFDRGQQRQQAGERASPKDCSHGAVRRVFASRSDAATAEAAAGTNAGIGDASAGDYRGALEAYAEAARIDDRFAMLSYRMGQCQLALGEFDQALQSFERARNLDLFRFRADTRLNDVIRSVACHRVDVSLVDVERGIRDPAFAFHGIPGADVLYEHVHLNFAGNYAVAALLYPHVAARVVAARRVAEAVTAPPTPTECARWLVHTKFNEFEAAKSMAARMAVPPFTDEQGRWAQGEMGRRLAELTEPVIQQALDQYRAVLPGRSDDLLLGANYANVLYVTGDNAGAVRQYQALLGRYPHASDWQYFLGDALSAEGKVGEAEVWLRKAVRQESSNGAACGALGQLLLNAGRAGEAVEFLRQAADLNPDEALVRYHLAMAYYRIGALRDAWEHYQRAIQRAPELARPPYTLGEVLGSERGAPAR